MANLKKWLQRLQIQSFQSIFLFYLTLSHLTKVICVKLNEGRVVHGTLIGYDHFMNLSLRNVKVEAPGRTPVMCDSCVLRGAAILSFEAVNPT